MAYATYITEAIVCGTYDRNTADRSYLLFTRDAGMLYAEARGVRKEASKQRHALQDFSHIRVSLIKGKAGWRIGSVETFTNFFTNAPSREARGSVVAFIKTLRRFLRGEESAPAVYEHVLTVLPILCGSLTERAYTESLVTLRLFELLGYVSLRALPSGLWHDNLASATEASLGLTKREVDRLLTVAMESSHL